MTKHKALSPAFVKNAPPGKHCDGGGLWLHVRDTGGQWVLRYSVMGQRREMGLGGVRDVSLKEAREYAERYRRMAREGIDPIRERRQQKTAMLRPANNLSDIAQDAFESRKSQLKDDGKAGRWFSPLEIHVLPKLGRMPVEEISARDVKEALAPIWHTKAETARKAANRLQIVIKHAAAMELNVDIGMVEKAKQLLGRPRHTPQNTPTMSWQDAPAFYASLAEPTITHLALRLLMLTGSRSMPIRFAHVDQLKDDVWVIPAANMKAMVGKARDFHIPLSAEALSVWQAATQFARDGYLFPGTRKGVISDATMSRLMERRGLEARPHGFRSTLRTWLTDQTDASYEIGETILAHQVGNAVHRAYQHSDMLEQRRPYMDQWAMYLTGRQHG
jgi:integrase